MTAEHAHPTTSARNEELRKIAPTLINSHEQIIKEQYGKFVRGK
jgi:hypothetical protein